MGACTIGEIGRTLDTSIFTVVGLTGDTIIESDIDCLKEAWQQPLRW
jgi:hypothetical protein